MQDITVFISYSWESEKIKRFAKWFSYFLEKYDIKVKLDVFENYPGSNLQDYMEEGLNDSKYVICILTDSYKEKMNNPQTGVGTEIKHIENMGSKPFIIPIVQTGNFTNLPDLFKGSYFSEIDMNNPQSIDNKDPIFEIIRLFIHNEGILPTSSNNPIKSYAIESKEIQLLGTILNNSQFSIEHEDCVKFHYSHSGNKFIFGYKKMSFTSEWTKSGDNTIYSYNQGKSFFRLPNLNHLNKINSISDVKLFEKYNVSWGETFKIGDGLLWINQNDIVAVGLINYIFTTDEPSKCYVEFEYKILNPLENESPFEGEIIPIKEQI